MRDTFSIKILHSILDYNNVVYTHFTVTVVNKKSGKALALLMVYLLKPVQVYELIYFS